MPLLRLPASRPATVLVFLAGSFALLAAASASSNCSFDVLMPVLSSVDQGFAADYGCRPLIRTLL